MTMQGREILLQEMSGLPEPLIQEVVDFVRFLKEKSVRERLEPALLSTPVLSQDWLRPEEEAAWADL